MIFTVLIHRSPDLSTCCFRLYSITNYSVTILPNRIISIDLGKHWQHPGFCQIRPDRWSYSSTEEFDHANQKTQQDAGSYRTIKFSIHSSYLLFRLFLIFIHIVNTNQTGDAILIAANQGLIRHKRKENARISRISGIPDGFWNRDLLIILSFRGFCRPIRILKEKEETFLWKRDSGEFCPLQWQQHFLFPFHY